MVGSKPDFPPDPDTLSSSLAIRPEAVRAHVARQGLGHAAALLEVERLRLALERIEAEECCGCSVYARIARAALEGKALPDG